MKNKYQIDQIARNMREAIKLTGDGLEITLKELQEVMVKFLSNKPEKLSISLETINSAIIKLTTNNNSLNKILESAGIDRLE